MTDLMVLFERTKEQKRIDRHIVRLQKLATKIGVDYYDLLREVIKRRATKNKRNQSATLDLGVAKQYPKFHCTHHQMILLRRHLTSCAFFEIAKTLEAQLHQSVSVDLSYQPTIETRFHIRNFEQSTFSNTPQHFDKKSQWFDFLPQAFQFVLTKILGRNPSSTSLREKS